MKKRIILSALLVMGLFAFAACQTTTTTAGTTTTTSSAVVLSSITFAGTDDITLDNGVTFNVLTGVTATGNDGVDYTSSIVILTTSSAVNTTTGALDTTKTGTHGIKYQVTVGTIVAERWRYITVKEPEAVEGEFLVNPDFAAGTSGWDSPNVVYIADGAAMTLSEDNGALKVEVVSGANAYTPRFGQMNVPFEMGKTYQISFDAKSSVEKIINLQVGELLSGAPYFTDFKPGVTVHKTITTEWATYSYKFTMNLDNQRGGLLFELGTVDSLDIDATMWFDNIKVEESTADADTLEPVFTGTKAAVEIAYGATFDPAKNVTAYDATDGDLTADIVISYENAAHESIAAIDFGVPGIYYIIYTVEDAAENVATFTTTLTIKSLNFSDVNLVADGSFDTELDATNPEWTVWSQTWGTAPVIAAGIDTVNGVYNVGITNGGGDAAWAVQLQSAFFQLQKGETYLFSITASASVARDINVGIGWTNTENNAWTEFGRQNGLALTTTPKTYTFLFTVAPDTHDVIVALEMGSMTNFAEGVVTVYDVAVYAEAAPTDTNHYSTTNMVANASFASALNETTPEWAVWSQDWGTAPVVTAGIDTANGVYNVGITNGGGDAAWAVQLFQNGFFTCEQGKTYKVVFKASATVARTLNLAIGWSDEGNNWTEFGRQNGILLSTTEDTYEYIFTVGPATHLTKLVFELGSMDGFAEGTVTFSEVAMYEAVEFSDVNLIADPSFAAALNETTPEWAVWSQDWGTAPVVTAAIDTVNGVYNLGITNGGGDAAWAIQLFQNGYFACEQGKTYLLTFTASATVARTINVAVGWSDESNNWTEFGRQNGVLIGTTETTVSFVFTVGPASHDAKLVFEVGSMDGFAEGTLTFYEASLFESVDFDTVNLVADGSFDSALTVGSEEWVVWSQNWGSAPTVVGAIDTTAGVYNVAISNGGGDAAWAIQLQSKPFAMTQGVLYRVKVTVSATVARTINVAVGWTNTENNAWTEFGRVNAVEIGPEAKTLTLIFTAVPASHDVILVFEMGTCEAFAEGTVTVHEALVNAEVQVIE